MLETKIYKGLWWLPERTDNQIPGTLTVEKNKISLETIGVLDNDNPLTHYSDRNAPHYDVIWGISSEAKEISIFNCYESISLNFSSPFAIAHYSAQVVAVGRHIGSLEELGNYDVTAYIEELSYWFKPNCLHSNLEEQRYTCSAEIKNTPHIAVQIEKDCSLKIEGEAQFSCSKTGMRMEFEQKSSLNFYAANKAAVDAREPIFLGYLFHLYSDGYFNYDFYRTIKRSPKWSHLNPDEKQDIKHHDFWLYDSKFHHYLQIESPAEMQHLAHLANTIDAADIEPADIADLERVLKYELNTSVVDEPYQFYTEERLEDLVGSTIQSFSHDYLGESYA